MTGAEAPPACISRARDYRAYGLHIRSPIPLPFTPGPAGGAPDVAIRLGAVPDALAAPAARGGIWECGADAFLLKVDGVARYRVGAGREIVVEPTGDNGPGDPAVQAFLLGSVLAACLQQRGVLTLHASAVETPAGAVLFAGVSGSGKSTLLASLVDRGYPMLADDVTGVRLDRGERPVALSAFPCVRLWGDAADALDWRGRLRGKVRDQLDKHLAPVERFRAEPLAVRAVFTLASHNRDRFDLETAPPAAAFETLLRYTFRMRYLRGLGRQPDHFRAAAALAKRVPVTRLTRPAHPFRLDALADAVERRLADPDLRPRPTADSTSSPAGAARRG